METPYQKVLRERGGKPINATFSSTKKEEGREQRDNRMRNTQPEVCRNCHRYYAKPYLQPQTTSGYTAGTWYWLCSEMSCPGKYEMEDQRVESELQPEHGAVNNDGPMLYGTYNTHTKSWSSKKKSLDDDFYSLFGGRSATKVSESEMTYSDGGWH